MEDVPGDVGAGARLVGEKLSALVAGDPSAYPGRWLPQGTFEELLERSDREPIHLHPAIHHLHHRWDMGPARRWEGSGRGPKSIGRRLLARIVGSALDRYFAEEQDYRAAIARSVDAVAYRVDEIASADERALMEALRKDLIDLARYIDERIDERLGDS